MKRLEAGAFEIDKSQFQKTDYISDNMNPFYFGLLLIAISLLALITGFAT